jgi:hypothetical protein
MHILQNTKSFRNAIFVLARLFGAPFPTREWCKRLRAKSLPRHKGHSEASIQKYSAVLTGIKFDAARHKSLKTQVTAPSNSFDLGFYFCREEKLGNVYGWVGPITRKVHPARPSVEGLTSISL